MNLTSKYPRSPRQRLAGLVHVPRMIDKARACKENTLGEYIYPCPLDKQILEFLNVDSDAFMDKASTLPEATIEEWVEYLVQSKSRRDFEKINESILNASPDTDDAKRKFKDILNSIDRNRFDITSWAELIDLEEGRM
ncbi:DUF5069 domain-containing protein [Nitrospina watsonii]|uniref:DUF5069 domain-containing protein n=1 Tax=Nitrospina watsonii TaxID=1323948 RepID=A0ABM9HDB5_9BACT|nr:DUF5069 domain-containing protein [Nitrospina watsonii]CAI2718101.1 conserved protein of unknown function [Nitrospina watsonii]